jgi:hypothetical protein
MKILLLAGAAALSLTVGIAYAGEGDVPSTNVPSVLESRVQNGQPMQSFVTKSDSSTWLNQGSSYEGANS